MYGRLRLIKKCVDRSAKHRFVIGNVLSPDNRGCRVVFLFLYIISLFSSPFFSASYFLQINTHTQTLNDCRLVTPLQWTGTTSPLLHVCYPVLPLSTTGLMPSSVPWKPGLDRVLCRVTWPNQTRFRRVPVARRRSCCPTRVAVSLQTKLMALPSMKEIENILLQHLVTNAWISFICVCQEEDYTGI